MTRRRLSALLRTPPADPSPTSCSSVPRVAEDGSASRSSRRPGYRGVGRAARRARRHGRPRTSCVRLPGTGGVAAIRSRSSASARRSDADALRVRRRLGRPPAARASRASRSRFPRRRPTSARRRARGRGARRLRLHRLPRGDARRRAKTPGRRSSSSLGAASPTTRRRSREPRAVADAVALGARPRQHARRPTSTPRRSPTRAVELPAGLPVEVDGAGTRQRSRPTASAASSASARARRRPPRLVKVAYAPARRHRRTSRSSARASPSTPAASR